MFRTLNLEKVTAIKRGLWEGTLTQADIARDNGISLATVWRIVTGRVWANAPWPDGSTGPLSDKRRVAIRNRYHQEKASALGLPAMLDITRAIAEAEGDLEDEAYREVFPAADPTPYGDMGSPAIETNSSPRQLSWEDATQLLTAAGRLDAVRHGKKDTLYREAVCISIANMSRSQIKEPLFDRLTEDVIRELKKRPTNGTGA